MARKRRTFDVAFKAKMALEAVRSLKRNNELAKQFRVHASQITQWKKQLLQGAPAVFERRAAQQSESNEAEVSELYEQIGPEQHGFAQPGFRQVGAFRISWE